MPPSGIDATPNPGTATPGIADVNRPEAVTEGAYLVMRNDLMNAGAWVAGREVLREVVVERRDDRQAACALGCLRGDLSRDIVPAAPDVDHVVREVDVLEPEATELAATEARDRFRMKRYRPSRRRARNQRLQHPIKVCRHPPFE